ncbi:calcium-binding protein [Limnohabitans sp. Hippo4]|uniref:beta strand repeat-containing protein n=1 Tax=Limnohabitans sp. Hippo4 TaxID=1826167 RepID=UPI000D3D44B1|nr:calcium-binding protein [Limnohabitans sp. Hippo4]PUE34188.1 hypothetical protein B9Z46_13245 [Limnohabitans sp. Hippo4]
MATVNAISVALFNAAAAGYSNQISKDPNSLANAVGLILEQDIATDAQFVEHLLANLGVTRSMSVYSDAKHALDELVFSIGRGQATSIAIDFLKAQEGAANDYGLIALNFAIKVNAATQYSTANPNERDITKLVGVITGVDTDQVAINNALAAVNPNFATNLTAALAAAETKAAADKAAEIAALKVTYEANAKNAADKAAADLKVALDKAAADAATTKTITDKALADANAATKAANEKAADAALKAVSEKAAAVAAVDKTTDNAAAITAYLKAAAAVTGLTGYDSMTDTQILAAIKASDNQTVAVSVDKTIDNPQAITAFLRTTASDLGVTGTGNMTDTQLINAIKTANDAFVMAQQKIIDDAVAANVKVATDAAATKAATDLANAIAATTSAVNAQKAADQKTAADLKVITDAAAAKAAADLKAVQDQLTAIQNLAGTTTGLSSENDTVMGVSGGNDIVTASNTTYGSDDVIVDTSTADHDVLTLSTVEDITATPVVVGIENINVNVTSVFAGAAGVTTLSFNADNIRSGTVNFDATNQASVVTDLTVTNAANLLNLTSTARYSNVNINGDANAILTYTGSPATLVMESANGALKNATATITRDTAGTITTDSSGTVTVTTATDTIVTANAASTVNVTSAGQATVVANAADTVIVLANEEALVTANSAELVTIFSGDGIDTTSTSVINSTLTSTNTNNIAVSVQGRGAATVLNLNGAPNVNVVNVSGTQNVSLKVGLDDIDGLGTSTSSSLDDNLLTVNNTSTGTVNILITNNGGFADFSAANIANLELATNLATGDIITVASNTSVVSAADQSYDLDLQAKTPSSGGNTVRISIKDDAVSGVTGDLNGGIRLSDFATATLTNNDADTYSTLGPVTASGTTLTIASGMQGFRANSFINLAAGTLRVTGSAPVNLGSSVTATDVAAADATGSITLELTGVGTVGTVVTGAGDDVFKISTLARTTGDYTISSGSGSDSLTVSIAEGFSWNGGIGYDTLKFDSSLDLTTQSVTLTSVDAISLDTSNDAAETLTLTAAMFNTNPVFTLLGGGTDADSLVILGSANGDTINASAVSVEVNEASLTINGLGGSDTITGSEFADTINGGAGADILRGGNYGDTYIFNTNDVDSGESITEASTGTGTDTVSVITTTDFSTMTAASFDEIEAIKVAANKTATFTGAQLTGESITLTGASAGTETLIVNLGLGETFVSGLSAGTDFNIIQYNGTGGDETITGGDLAEIITGGGGNDVLSGGAGADTFVFSSAAGNANGIDTITLSTTVGNTVNDFLDFTANASFIGASTVNRVIFSEADVGAGVSGAAAGQNVLFLTGHYFANATALAAANTLFTACDTGNVLIIYAGSVTENARIAFCSLDAAGDVTSATDVAILIGMTVSAASTGLPNACFILD